MVQNSQQIFFKLSELATKLEIETSVLRYWINEFKIKALQAGTRKKLYRIQDLKLFKEIKHLLHEEGYTIAGAKKYLKSAQAQQLSFGFLEKTGDQGEIEEMGQKGEMDSPLAPKGNRDEDQLKSALAIIEETRDCLQEIKEILGQPRMNSPQTNPDSNFDPNQNPKEKF